MEGIKRYYADVALISCPKVSTEFGLSDNHISEANVRRQMLKNAKKKILIVDHTKFEGNANVLFEGLEETDLIITDQRLPKEFEDYAVTRNIAIQYSQE